MALLKIDSQLLESARDIFHYPDPQSRETYQNSILPFVQWGRTRAIPGVTNILIALEQGELDWEELQVDYTRLFINNFPHAKAHPFAGWYIGDKVLFDQNERNMRAFYASHGVFVDDESVIPADHIMVELEFAAIMMEQYEKTGDIKYYFALQELWNNQLAKWIPSFAQEICLHANSDFYQTVGTLILALMDELQNEMKGVA